MPVDGFWPVLCAPVVALVALAAGAVGRSGALAGVVVGGAVGWGGGWDGFGMLATLLVAGTLFSARGSRKRDALQVLCNGGVAAACAVASCAGAEWGGLAMAGALAAALADTLAGEIGRRHGRAPRLMLFGPRALAGVDGAMTWTGTVAGAVGAAAVAVYAGDAFVPVLIAGFAGSVLDSAVGLWIQPGLGKRGNDWTNLLATAAAAPLAVALALAPLISR